MTESMLSNHSNESVRRLRDLFAVIGSEDDAQRMAEELIESFGSIENLFATSEDVVRGMWGKKVAAYVRIVAAVMARRSMDKYKLSDIRSRSGICEYLKAAFLGECIETVKVMPLDEYGVPLCCETVAHGTVNASDITVRSIAETAFAKGSKRIVLAHNHPRGMAVPSKLDIMLTSSIRQALLGIGITLEYHVVVSGLECELVDGFSLDADGEIRLEDN